jgi:Flp pilus assembly pilin Flp
MTQSIKRLWSEQKGQNVPEFALLLFLVCLTAVSAMGALAIKVNSMYFTVSTHMVAASNPALTGAGSFTGGAPSLAQIDPKDPNKQKPTD